MTAPLEQTSRGQVQRRLAAEHSIAAAGRDHGAACRAFCHEVNIPITASTDACCAGTEASLALALPGTGVIGATLVIEPADATLKFCRRTRKDIGAPADFAASADSLRYDNGPRQLRPEPPQIDEGSLRRYLQIGAAVPP